VLGLNNEGENIMKSLASIIALALAVAFAGPAFAGGGAAAPQTKAECQQAGGMWDEQTSKCAQGQ
jgi:hypothetical protein